MTEPDPTPLADAEPWLPLPVDVPASDDAHRARLAAAVLVRRVRPDLFSTDSSPAEVEHADVILGGQLLAARLWARRSSPTGLASYGEFGPAAVLRLDPDVERLLGIGRYGPPRVG